MKGSRRFACSDHSELPPLKAVPPVTARRRGHPHTPHPFAVMFTDSIAEWPDVWNGRGMGWAMPFPSMVQLRNPHHSANISPSTSRTNLAAKPEQCSRNRRARPSRSLCSASHRTDGAMDSTHGMVRQSDGCRHVGGTPTAAVEATALPVWNCMVPAKRSARWNQSGK